jgi:hypothetical protein
VTTYSTPTTTNKQELLTKRTPFDDLAWDYKVEIAIMEGTRPGVPDKVRKKRPEFVELMERCWNHNPDLRPTFAQIIEILATIDGGGRSSTSPLSSPPSSGLMHCG